MSETESLHSRKATREISGIQHTFALRLATINRAHALVLVLGPGTAGKHRIVGMSLDVLLQILWALEGLAAEVALMWLQWHMDPDVRSDVVTLDRGSTAARPLACEIEVIGALSANMTLADVILAEYQKN